MNSHLSEHRLEKNRKIILACVLKHAEDDVGLISALQLLLEEQGEEGYSAIFNILGDVDIAPSQAQSEWNKVVLHWEQLCGLFGRKIRVQTALCDYLASVHSLLITPKLIEVEQFEKVLALSRYDQLTGLLNRHFFEENLSREMARATRYGTELSLLFFDIDDFKNINDLHGHLAGDEVLRDLAALILREKRVEDSAIRYGGEEIALILPETNNSDAMVLAERIRQRIEEYAFTYRKIVMHVTVSGGLASFPADEMDQRHLVKKADIGLYRAKKAGKNCIVPYSQDKRKSVRVPFTEEMEVQCVGNPQRQVVSAKGKNLSSSGIFLESAITLPIDAKVNFFLSLDNNSPSRVAGKVVRVEEKGPQKYGLGVAFQELEQDITRGIQQYVCKVLQKAPLTNSVGGF